MKKFYFLVIGLCFFTIAKAQIVNIPDANFKAKLLRDYTAKDISGNYFKVDTNANGEIEESEALQVSELTIASSGISDLTGISSFKNLKTLYCRENSLTNLNFSGLTQLTYLDCSANSLTNLNVSGLTQLTYLDCNFNSLPNLNFSGLSQLTHLSCEENNLANLDLSYFPNLTYLNCNGNILTNLNVSGLSQLASLDCSENSLTNLNVSSLSNLTYLNCGENKLNSLNMDGAVSIKNLDCYRNKLTSLQLGNLKSLTSLNCEENNLDNIDVSNCPSLRFLLSGANNLKILNIKNGAQINLTDSLDWGNDNLKYICCNEDEVDQIIYSLSLYGNVNCNVNSYCSFVPGGTYYTIQGNSKLDINNNGYDSNDNNYSNLNFSITDGINQGNIISDLSGNYNIYVGEGTQTITPILENPTYYTVSPSSVNVTFPSQASPLIQNFYIRPNGVHNDVEVTILPTIPARPGFDATYKIIYKNKGTTTQSGSVNLSFNDAVLDYVLATPTINSQVTDKLTWDYINLQPFESREIAVTFNVNSPMETPAVNNGDRLSFNALINPVTGDEKPVDNSSALRQSVVGSYDPNDKTCLEGDVITPELIGEYVNYLIRFENTGTYPAQNVVVKDLIDLTKFDISTLVPVKSSHEFVTKISDGNKVEFIFENINLPFDDATNDGYIAFKIKTLPTLVVGDTFENEANIYFDYNFPVLTNKAKSTFKTLETQDFEFLDYFNVYPNPVNAVLNIGTKNSIEVESIAVYDVLGQLIIAVPDSKNVSNIDVSKLNTGNYFLKMNTNKGTSNVKFIKK